MADDLQPPLNAEEKLRAKFLKDLRELMSQPNFRSVLWHLIEGPAWCAAFHHGLVDDRQMAFAEGKREVGMNLVKVAMAVGDANYMKMQAEARNLRMQYELEDLRTKAGT